MSDTVMPMPSASVDFNALHDAAMAGDGAAVAMEKAVASANGEPEPEFPALTGKTKKELLAIAKKEGATIDPDYLNDEMIDAIEAHRRGEPYPPIDMSDADAPAAE